MSATLQSIMSENNTTFREKGEAATSLETSNISSAGELKDPGRLEKEQTIYEFETVPEDEDDSYNKIKVPDGGYGWVVVFSSFLLNFCTSGASYGYGVYLSYYMDSGKYETGGKLDYAAIGGLSFGVGVLFSPLYNYILINTSPRKLISLGIVIQNVAALLAAFSTKLWQVYLTQGVFISIGTGAICFPNTTIAAPWFRKKRSLALGITVAGTGVGGIVFNLSTQRIIDNYDSKWALISQCIICSVLSTVAVLLIRTRRDEVQKYSDTPTTAVALDMFKYPVIWLLILWVCFTMLGYVVQVYSLFSFTISLGYTSKQASAVSCVICVGIIVGRPLVGLAADKFGAVTTGMFCHLIVAFLCYGMWIPCRNYATVVVFGLFEGMLMGSIWLLLTSIITRLVGLPKLEAVYSVVWMFLGVCAIVSPVIGISLAKNNVKPGENAYLYTAVYCGTAYLLAALALWCIRGIIIARDKVSLVEKTGYDDGELHLRVNLVDALKGMAHYGKLYRKV